MSNVTFRVMLSFIFPSHGCFLPPVEVWSLLGGRFRVEQEKPRVGVLHIIQIGVTLSTSYVNFSV